MSDSHQSLEEHVMRSARAHLVGHADAFGVLRGRVLVHARGRVSRGAARGTVASLSARFGLAGRRATADPAPCG